MRYRARPVLAVALLQLASCSGGKAQPPSGGVLQHHNHATRDGVYIEPTFTRAAAPMMSLDPTFAPAVTGAVYAQPLYLEANSPGKPDLLIVATEQNHVHAFDGMTGAPIWDRQLAAPVAMADLPCGNIDPLGITGTPIIDGATRAIYLDALTTPDGGTTKKHLVFALDADTGNTRAGWPVDVSAKAHVGAVTFDSSVQSQRGALALLGGTLFVPYGAHAGDCGGYHGWIVGISISDPSRVSAWATRGARGGIWGPAGISSDGSSIYFATGNTSGQTTWQDGEAIFRLAPSLAPSDNPSDYYAPSNWLDLDNGDGDLGGTAPVLFDVPGATPSALAIALGKDGKAYLVDRTNLGGVGAPLAGLTIGEALITVAAAYTTPSGTYVAFKGTALTAGCPGGTNGHSSALKVVAGSPPTLAMAWCSLPDTGSATVSVTDATGADAIVWMMSSDDRLYSVNGDTGGVNYHAATDPTMPGVQKLMAPMIAKGRIFVAGTGRVYVLRLQ
jgi:outer membrane protein assembly factor BamB